MTIEKLNELIEKSKLFGNQLKINLFETYPNVHPTLKNPLNHFNDIRVEFSFYTNIFGVHMMSKMSVKDFFDQIDKIANREYDPYKKWKQIELREYKINKILLNE